MKNLRVSRRKEIIKVRAEINEKETKETIAKVQKTKSWFFEKTNKIDKPIARVIQEKKKNTERERLNRPIKLEIKVKTDNTEIENII